MQRTEEGNHGSRNILYTAVHSSYLLLIRYHFDGEQFICSKIFYSASVLVKDTGQMDVETEAHHLQEKKHTSTSVCNPVLPDVLGQRGVEFSQH